MFRDRTENLIELQPWVAEVHSSLKLALTPENRSFQTETGTVALFENAQPSIQIAMNQIGAENKVIIGGEEIINMSSAVNLGYIFAAKQILSRISPSVLDIVIHDFNKSPEETKNIAADIVKIYKQNFNINDPLAIHLAKSKLLDLHSINPFLTNEAFINNVTTELVKMPLTFSMIIEACLASSSNMAFNYLRDFVGRTLVEQLHPAKPASYSDKFTPDTFRFQVANHIENYLNTLLQKSMRFMYPQIRFPHSQAHRDGYEENTSRFMDLVAVNNIFFEHLISYKDIPHLIPEKFTEVVESALRAIPSMQEFEMQNRTHELKCIIAQSEKLAPLLNQNAIKILSKSGSEMSFNVENKQTRSAGWNSPAEFNEDPQKLEVISNHNDFAVLEINSETFAISYSVAVPVTIPLDENESIVQKLEKVRATDKVLKALSTGVLKDFLEEFIPMY